MNVGSDKHAKQKFEKLIRTILFHETIIPGQLTETFKNLLDHKLGDANEASLGAFFAALQSRLVTNQEIVELFEVVQNYDKIPAVCSKDPYQLFGIVGSGKDEFKTYNVSTGAAFVAAALGVPMIKNGSRSDTSIAGTTDLLEGLGCPIELTKIA